MQILIQRRVDVRLLCQRFEYHPESGTLTPKTKTSSVRVNNDGYLVVTFGGVTITVASAIWFFEYGEFSDDSILHKDGDRKNNHISNLYVSDCIKKFEGKFKVVYKKKYLGVFGKIEEAEECRDAYLKKMLRRRSVNGQTN